MASTADVHIIVEQVAELHVAGRPVAEIKVGENLTGTVTNFFHRRVWVDVGLEKDASFEVQGTVMFEVGDVLEGLTVSAVDLQKGHVRVTPPPRAEASTAQSQVQTKAVASEEAHTASAL